MKPASSSKFRLLCLHGMYQNAEVFATKTRHLRVGHADCVEFIYVNGPFMTVPKIVSQRRSSSQSKNRVECKKRHDEFRAWWRPSGPHQPCPTQLDQDRLHLIHYMKERLHEIGPVDGVLGFSQGASLAAWLCTTEARYELAWSPQLAVLIGGYMGPQQYAFQSGIEQDVRSLHLYGENDHVVSAAKSEKLARIFRKAQVHDNQVVTCSHDQGHVVPKSEHLIAHVHSFLTTGCISNHVDAHEDYPAPAPVTTHEQSPHVKSQQHRLTDHAQVA